MSTGSGRSGIRRQGLSAWRGVERGFDRVPGPALNPLRQLGALAFLAMLVLAASGIVLFAGYDTSVAGAYHSVERLAHWPLGLGNLVRGLHRYAADALIVLVALHVLREWLHAHERGARRFHWLTGVPLLGFLTVSAIGGFWLAWDRLGRYSAEASAEWLDALPLFGAPLARNFLTPDAVSDRLFALLIFIHVGMPLMLLFGFWFHVQRLNHARVLPPRRLAAGFLAMLAVLALVLPVLSQAPLAGATAPLRFDWLLLWLHPLTEATSRGFTWALVGGLAFLLFAAPFLPQPARPPIAVVDPPNCSGCELCVDDCPYAALEMVPLPGGRPGQRIVEVDPARCVGCGICAGSCPSATPFRSVEPLVSGIDMPQLPVDALRRNLRRKLVEAPPGEAPLVVFGCDQGAAVAALAGEGVIVESLLCAGQLPPSLVEYVLRQGAAGVLVVHCGEAGCEFRLGGGWIAARLAGEREPRLRPRSPRERVLPVEAVAGGEPRLGRALASLRARVQGLPPPPAANEPRNRHA